MRPGPRHGADAGGGVVLVKAVQEFGDVLREAVGLIHVAAQGTGGGHVGARRAAEAEVDALAREAEVARDAIRINFTYGGAQP